MTTRTSEGRAGSITRRFALSALTLGLVAFAACGDDDDSTPNVTANAVVAVSGGGQSALPGVALGAPLVVKVTNDDGDPIEGVLVNFTATGGGTLGASSATTNAQGMAQTTFTLGYLLGTQTVTATVSGVTAPATFTLTTSVVTNPVITVVSGDAQTAVRATQLTAPLIVMVKDANGHALQGSTVNWTAATGTLSSATSTTSATGQAQVNYTLPNSAGANTITATVNGTAATVTFTATGT